MNHPYIPVLIFFGVALAVPVASLTLARVWMNFFTPIKRGSEKNALYECGVNPLAGRQTRFHSQYYLFGLLFLLFDVRRFFSCPSRWPFSSFRPGRFSWPCCFCSCLPKASSGHGARAS